MLNLNSRFNLHLSYETLYNSLNVYLLDYETQKKTHVSKVGSSYTLEYNELGLSGTAEQIYNQLESLFLDLNNILQDEWLKTVEINNSLYNGNLTIYGAIETTYG